MGLFTTQQYHCMCRSCGREWRCTKDDIKKSKQNHKLNEARKSLGAGSFLLGGGLLSLALFASPNLPEISLNRCPFCGSKRVRAAWDGFVLK